VLRPGDSILMYTPDNPAPAPPFTLSFVHNILYVHQRENGLVGWLGNGRPIFETDSIRKEPPHELSLDMVEVRDFTLIAGQDDTQVTFGVLSGEHVAKARQQKMEQELRARWQSILSNARPADGTGSGTLDITQEDDKEPSTISATAPTNNSHQKPTVSQPLLESSQHSNGDEDMRDVKPCSCRMK
jgi:hypothetical protein